MRSADRIFKSLGFSGTRENNKILVHSSGLCGGMCFACLDYFFAGVQPSGILPEFELRMQFSVSSKWFVRTVEQGFTRYLHRRQMDSFGIADLMRFVLFLFFPDGIRKLRSVMPGELMKLEHEIKSGKPCVLALIHKQGVKNFNSSHQVIAFGLEHDEKGEMVLLIYDPNFPGREMKLRSHEKGRYWKYDGSGKQWSGFFVQRYRRKKPFPV